MSRLILPARVCVPGTIYVAFRERTRIYPRKFVFLLEKSGKRSTENENARTSDTKLENRHTHTHTHANVARTRLVLIVL